MALKSLDVGTVDSCKVTEGQTNSFLCCLCTFCFLFVTFPFHPHPPSHQNPSSSSTHKPTLTTTRPYKLKVSKRPFRPHELRLSFLVQSDSNSMSRPKQRSKSLPECPSNGDGSENIPDVLYAPDGRKFFPCRYCCRAFAFKKGQVSHIKACAFRVFEVRMRSSRRMFNLTLQMFR